MARDGFFGSGDEQRALIFLPSQTFLSEWPSQESLKCFLGFQDKGGSMFLILALVLILAWVGGFVVFHTAGFLIHLLLVFAVISIIFHFLRGRSAAV
jgi:hypothetical protein